MADLDDAMQLPVRYVGVDDVPVLLANQFLLQAEQHSDGFIVSIGQLTPPILMGSADEQRQQAQQIPFVPIRIIGRYSLSRERAAALAGLLQQALAVTSGAKQGDPA